MIGLLWLILSDKLDVLFIHCPTSPLILVWLVPVQTLQISMGVFLDLREVGCGTELHLAWARLRSARALAQIVGRPKRAKYVDAHGWPISGIYRRSSLGQGYIGQLGPRRYTVPQAPREVNSKLEGLAELMESLKLRILVVICLLQEIPWSLQDIVPAMEQGHLPFCSHFFLSFVPS